MESRETFKFCVNSKTDIRYRIFFCMSIKSAIKAGLKEYEFNEILKIMGMTYLELNKSYRNGKRGTVVSYR